MSAVSFLTNATLRSCEAYGAVVTPTKEQCEAVAGNASFTSLLGAYNASGCFVQTIADAAHYAYAGLGAAGCPLDTECVCVEARPPASGPPPPPGPPPPARCTTPLFTAVPPAGGGAAPAVAAVSCDRLRASLRPHPDPDV
jgi:hypothetical protein